VAVLELHLLAAGEVMHDLGLGVGIALELGSDIAIRRRFLFLVDGVALESTALARKHLRGIRINCHSSGCRKRGCQRQAYEQSRQCVVCRRHGFLPRRNLWH
jgi:hypothetical protein